jgi:hypothetical protein
MFYDVVYTKCLFDFKFATLGIYLLQQPTICKFASLSAFRASKKSMKSDDVKMSSSKNHDSLSDGRKRASTSRKELSSREKRLRQEEEHRKALEDLLSSTTMKEKESARLCDEINDLLSIPTAKEQLLVSKFRNVNSSMREFCQRGTRAQCEKFARAKPC